MNVSAIAWASGTRPIPQKNNTAMIVTMIPRATWIFITRRDGHAAKIGRGEPADSRVHRVGPAAGGEPSVLEPDRHRIELRQPTGERRVHRHACR